MQTQRELELEAYGYGKNRAAQRIDRREGRGQADENPYAQAVYRRFVLPLAEVIKADQNAVKTRGPQLAHRPLIAAVDPEPAAFVAVRAALVQLMGAKADRARVLITEVGKAVYHELLLTNFESLEPKLFHQLTLGFARRLDMNERYRLNAYREEAESKGLALPEWEGSDIERVGAWVVSELATLGMLTIQTQSLAKKQRVLVSALTEETSTLISGIREMVVENSPYFLPCVEPPIPWTKHDEGGWHTDEMRRLMPYAIKTHAGVRHLLDLADLTKELACLNALQETKWRINRPILEALRLMGGKIDLGEVLAQGEEPRPERPEWLGERMAVEAMDVDQAKEFRAWKRLTAKWHRKKKERAVKWGRYRHAMQVATKFVEYDALHFVYFCDFRGRKYAMTTGVSPQGSDLQKALLHFAEGKPLHTQGAKDWFHITGANRYGYDKVDLQGRIDWVQEHREDILAAARDPVANGWWLKGSKPLQFLAWCFEYAEWQVLGDSFLSHLSAGMDGSCNGLQNFSAMLRDEVGGKATNLVPMPKPQDIYGRVGEVTTTLLLEVPPDPLEFSNRWLAHGINRSIVKRSVR